jgi:hypothetical protein
MHDIEPFFNWLDYYVSEEDDRSPFFGREYSQFEFSQKVYNYYLHPLWDDFGSNTLYLKVIVADYEANYVIIELIGEWNDAIENDIMSFKREVVDVFLAEGITKFILIAENVFNFHSGDTDYYEEWFEEVTDNDGWMICLNMPEHSMQEFKKARLHQYLEMKEMENWRTFKPYHLFKKLDHEMRGRLNE